MSEFIFTIRCLALSCCSLFVFSGCTSTSGQNENEGPGVGPELFSPELEFLTIEVDYAQGAEPYTGSVALASDIWDLFRVNAERVFEGTETAVHVPSTLDDMENLGEMTDQEFTVEDILDIAEQHRDSQNTENTIAFYVVWLPGYFHDGDEVLTGVLGVSLGNTGIIAMFKPVIESTEMPLFPSVAPFVEQSTLIHEFGHAIGLVNNGIPIVDDHHDEEHGAHCTNQDCVMYWANEGAAELRDFVRDYVLSGDSVLFGPSCLADIANVQSSQ